MDDVAEERSTHREISYTDDELRRVKSCLGIRPTPYPIFITVFLCFVAVGVSQLLICESVIYNKVCYQHFENLTICVNTTFTKSHPDLQEDAARWSAYMMAVQIVPAIVINMMLSSYSDTVGFKLPLTIPLLGSAGFSTLLALLADPRFLHWPMWLLLIAGFLSSSCGGVALLLMTSYAYISKLSSPARRPVYLTILEGSAAAGVLIGMVGGGALIDLVGLSSTAYGAAALSVSPFLVTLIFTVELPRRESTTLQSLSWTSRIGVRRMLDAINCVFKARDGYSRLKLNLCYLANFLVSMAATGFAFCSFLYFHKQFGLSIMNYSAFFGYVMGAIALGGPIIIKLMKSCLGFSNISAAAISSAFLTVGYSIMSIDFLPYYAFYIGGGLIAFQSVVYASVRTYAVELISVGEIGKIFAFDAMLQVIQQLCASILMKWMYSVTVEVFPGFFVAFCALLCLMAFVALISVGRLDRVPARSQEEVDETRPLLA